ncbi:MAG: hypothetical protein H7Y17_07600 [Chlorobia bacterium]|nr:hypothetical protein [Fimbriimonadaceae bacterium]
MCYSLYISTTSEHDLSELNSDLCQFEKYVGPEDQEIVDLLAHPSKWYLSVYGSPGCSCHFRHKLGGDVPPYFEEPQEWANEDSDEIESTLKAYDHFKWIVDAGHSLDIVDVWTETKAEQVMVMEVSLGKISREAFHFIEDVRFVVSK